ncbi:non-repetitive nucleoporin [Microthyrium microscopicum]|uniref:Non-repetitive nucleoporin n=1 Tax=Microthyrium microscopicum TaxID=703497 RepID=A0A6A6TSZ5_9PEZI|nr:non-repetitive nucleoporin [Microthyrium microscopicum]
MATPQRPLPGAFLNTPAPVRPQVAAQRPPAFRLPSNPGLPKSSGQVMATNTTGNASNLTPGALSTTRTTANQKPIQRAAARMNQASAIQLRFPALDDYIIQGVSSDYEQPTSQSWAPFEKTKTYDIPERIFEQVNNAHMSTKLGIFSQLHHAWVTVDSVLYLWDYTHPNPELIGYDELSQTIVEVQLAKPKPGVFREEITHVLLIATVGEIAILALAANKSPEGVMSVSLYQTDLRISLKGYAVTQIASCPKTGRVFFGCKNSSDLFEISYQKEEKWFLNKCGKINHTSQDVTTVASPLNLWNIVSSTVSGQASTVDYIRQIEVDSTRDVIYVLYSSSTIQVFHMSGEYKLTKVIHKRQNELMSNVAHMVPRSNTNWKLFPNSQYIASLQAIPRTESSRLALLATTGTGVRMYLSVTSGYSASSMWESAAVPSSMQIHHIKFPPPPANPPSTNPAAGNNMAMISSSLHGVDTESMALTTTIRASRFSPGFQFFFVGRTDQADLIYISAPDSARLGRQTDSGSPSRFIETGQWVPLGANVEGVGLSSPAFAANTNPAGFGNEMAVQFDQSATEVAVLTNSGIHTFRRRRLVDTFAAALKDCATEEDFDNVVKKFVRNYGRQETVASALGVACGQATDTSTDSSLADPEVLNYARRTVIEHGGKPDLGDLLDPSQASLDNVRISSRAEALILYTTRLVRSVWTAKVIQEGKTPAGGITIASTTSMQKLQSVTAALIALKNFLDTNKTSISGMSGAEEMNRIASITDRTALQAEHRILDAQVKTISNIIEGIAFLTQLFDNRVDETFLSLDEPLREKFRQLTYEVLFTLDEGKDLAKELVKAIVNRSIAAGSNVETVADALQRRCGSFCSTDDVIIFKAQENLQKATDAGAESPTARTLLNSSLDQFKKVAGTLSTPYLQAAVDQYLNLQFFAGAIQLCLEVAHKRDEANRALAWIKDGQPQRDEREEKYNDRINCYQQIWRIIEAADAIPVPAANDTLTGINMRRKEEVYNVIDLSTDEVFQNCLYDWYLSKNWSHRLLDLKSPFVVAYLKRKFEHDSNAAELLWKYYVHHHEYFEAAKIQLQLAKSGFAIDLQTRIEYLSRAKANASTRMSTFGRVNSSKQEVIREITDQLDCASVQLDAFRKLEEDTRLVEPNRSKVLKQLNGPVMSLDELYNSYVSLAGYFDLALIIFQLSDYRNTAEITSTWLNMINDVHQAALNEKTVEPYIKVQECVRRLGIRVHCSEIVFQPHTVLQILIDYNQGPEGRHSVDSQMNGPRTWPVELLLELGIPIDTILIALEALLFDDTSSSPQKRRTIADLVCYVSNKWLVESEASGTPVGGEEALEVVAGVMEGVLESGVMGQAGGLGAAREVLERVRYLR